MCSIESHEAHIPRYKMWSAAHVRKKEGTSDSQVGAHNDEQVGPLGHFRFEELGVLEGLFGGVDRARADDDEKTFVVAGEDASGAEACGGDGVEGLMGGLDLMAEEGGLNEGVIMEADHGGRKRGESAGGRRR